MDTQKVQVPKRVIGKLSISCGCGYVAKDMQSASGHTQTTGHTLSVHGLIGLAEKISHMEVVR